MQFIEKDKNYHKSILKKILKHILFVQYSSSDTDNLQDIIAIHNFSFKIEQIEAIREICTKMQQIEIYNNKQHRFKFQWVRYQNYQYTFQYSIFKKVKYQTTQINISSSNVNCNHVKFEILEIMFCLFYEGHVNIFQQQIQMIVNNMPGLQQLGFSQITGCNPNQIKLLSNLTHLTSLTFGFIRPFLYQTFQSITQYLTQLIKLVFEQCDFLKSKCLLKIKKMTKLKKLKLINCSIDKDHLQQFISKLPQSITEIGLKLYNKDYKSIDLFEYFNKIFKQCKNIVSVDFPGSLNKDEQIIFQKFQNLEQIQLVHRYIKYNDIFSLTQKCPNLIKLNLNICYGLANKTLKIISSFILMRDLTITSSLEAEVYNNSGIIYLSKLRYLQKIKMVGLLTEHRSIQKLLENNKRLKLVQQRIMNYYQGNSFFVKQINEQAKQISKAWAKFMSRY